MYDTKEINKSNDTVERFYYNDSSQFVENYDYNSQISILEYKRTGQKSKYIRKKERFIHHFHCILSIYTD